MTEIESIQEGAILRVTTVMERTLTVRVTRGRIFSTTSDAGNLYVTFPGIRIRPTELNVSFGNERYYTNRLSRIEVIRSAS